MDGPEGYWEGTGHWLRTCGWLGHGGGHLRRQPGHPRRPRRVRKGSSWSSAVMARRVVRATSRRASCPRCRIRSCPCGVATPHANHEEGASMRGLGAAAAAIAGMPGTRWAAGRGAGVAWALIRATSVGCNGDERPLYDHRPGDRGTSDGLVKWATGARGQTFECQMTMSDPRVSGTATGTFNDDCLPESPQGFECVFWGSQTHRGPGRQLGLHLQRDGRPDGRERRAESCTSVSAPLATTA